ncbi:hypothetical protein B0O99DRAFT_507675 [Bisporella sp. PMI_857]|nr:hypothetical protein B0O99DRAFT_507675 [Bisporella sp. PMI_857]
MRSEDDITIIDLDTYVPNNLRNCPICAEALTTWNFPSFNVTMNCAHEDKVCFGCLEKYIHVETQSKSLERITQLCCPLCPEKLSHDNCHTYAAKADFERYNNRYDQLLAISAVPEAAMCLGPSCLSAQVHEGGSFMTCDACNFQTCIKHNIPWHTGETCDEYDKRVSINVKPLEGMNAPVKLLSESCIICPKWH